MQLYYANGTISIAVAIALYEADLPFETTRLNFRAAEQTDPGYLALNPKGRVPTLITDDGAVLTETGAILEYISSLAPEARLVPTDPREAAQMRAVMYYLASTAHVNHAHKLRGQRWADRRDSFADMAAKVPQTMTETAGYIEAHCLRGPYVLGEHFSIADPYTFILCNWMEGDGVALADFPKLSAYLRRMRTRPSVLRAIEQRMI